MSLRGKCKLENNKCLKQHHYQKMFYENKNNKKQINKAKKWDIKVFDYAVHHFQETDISKF